MIAPHIDLGIKQLFSDWRNIFSRRFLLNDAAAGFSVACIAIPLSLAIALASGVKPEIGLISAMVAGVVCALFGGVPFVISGPAAAMTILIAAVVEEYGFNGMLMVGLGCGILQLLTGVFGLGRLIRFIPIPVVMGITAGIGALILIGQFPRILGMPAPNESNIVSVILHARSLVLHTDMNAFLLAVSTILLTIFLPRIWPRVPAPLFAVLIPAVFAFYLHLPVELIGSMPTTLPTPKFPFFSGGTNEWFDLLSATMIVYGLASLESLLSANAVAQLAKINTPNPNQELIGQGLGNIVTAIFSGIPVTAVLARSALNVQAGAKTRRASLFHSFFLLITVLLLSHFIEKIPVAVIAGFMMTVALRMCSPHEFLQLWYTARNDALTYLATFILIVVLGLMSGIQIGILAALIFAGLRLSQVKIRLHTNEFGPAQLSLDGLLTFLCAGKIDDYEEKLTAIELPNGLIVDLSRIKAIDKTGAKHIIQLIAHLQLKNIKSVLYVTEPEQINTLTAVKPDVKSIITNNELEMEKILGIQDKHQQLTLDRVISGIEKFKKNLHPKHKAMFSSLAKQQKPHTLFITCCDSRIDPNLITSTQPGELFILRNVGNIVSPFGKGGETPAEGAAIEYAVGVLDVKQVIVCAHSECGAIEQVLTGAIFSAENQKKYPSVAAWLTMLNQLKNRFSTDITSEKAAKLNASLQLNNLRTYPIIQEKIASGTLKLKAFYYDIGNADVQIWDEVLGRYRSIGENTKGLVFGANQMKGYKV